MPMVMLLGCYGFIAWAYWRDGRNNPYPSKALWLPVLWMMRCASRDVDFWLGGGESSRIDPVLIAILFLGGAIVLSRRRCYWGPILAHNATIIIFYAYMF